MPLTMYPKNGQTNTRANSTTAGTNCEKEPLRNKNRLGVIPKDAKLTARHKEIPAWDEMPEKIKPVLRREMEVYAGFLEFTDHHVGRLLDSLKESGHT